MSDNLISYSDFNMLRFLKNSIEFYDKQPNRHLYLDQIKRERENYEETLAEIKEKS